MLELILNIDDSESKRYARTRILTQAGFIVKEGTSGREAMELAASDDPSLILLDIRLPDVSGFEVSKQLKRDPKTATIPILHISSVGLYEHDYPAALESGAEAYLREPVEPSTLVSMVTALVRGKKAEVRARLAERDANMILDSICDAYLRVDKSFCLTYANQAVESIFGRRRETFIGNKFWDLALGLPEEQAAQFRRVLRERAISVFETPDREGNRWYEVSAFPVDGGAITISYRDITARKRAESELNKSASILRAINEGTDNMIVVKDREGRIVMANPAALRVLDKDEGSLLGKTELEFLPDPAQARQIMENDRRIMENGRLEVVEETAETPRGTVTYLFAKAPYRDREGNVIGLTGIGANITDRKKANDELRALQAKLALALKAGRSGTFDWDVVNDINSWSDETLELYGLRREEFGGTFEDWRASVVPEDVEGATWKIDDARQNRELSSDFRIRRRDTGEIRWINARGMVLFDGAGRPSRMIGINVDITARKQAEEALRESEARERARAEELEAVMDAVPAATFIARDPECRVILGSRTTHEIFRVPAGANLSKSAPEDEKPTQYRIAKNGREVPPPELPVQMAASSGQAVRSYEFDVVYGDGTSITLMGDAVPLLDGCGRPRGSVGAFVDVSELKRVENELRRSNEDLQRFAYAASHDLQEPLRSIGAMSLMLDNPETGLSQEGRECVSRIQTSVKQMQTLIKDLLEYSRYSGGADIEMGPADCGALFQLAFTHLQSAVAESGAHIAAEELPVVHGNDGALLRVFQNLLGNAIKYRSAKPPEVRVWARPRAGEWVFAVEDNGIGIEMRYAERIFDAFRRLHSRDKIEGSGIGLAIVKRIVERHGGRVWVESQPGKGSTFFFTLPGCPEIVVSSAAD
ncbi:MAG: PAS domain-containing protein [Bryobacteraceae bacterium]